MANTINVSSKRSFRISNFTPSTNRLEANIEKSSRYFPLLHFVVSLKCKSSWPSIPCGVHKVCRGWCGSTSVRAQGSPIGLRTRKWIQELREGQSSAVFGGGSNIFWSVYLVCLAVGLQESCLQGEEDVVVIQSFECTPPRPKRFQWPSEPCPSRNHHRGEPNRCHRQIVELSNLN